MGNAFAVRQVVSISDLGEFLILFSLATFALDDVLNGFHIGITLSMDAKEYRVVTRFHERYLNGNGAIHQIVAMRPNNTVLAAWSALLMNAEM
jgi:hypothetical protein